MHKPSLSPLKQNKRPNIALPANQHPELCVIQSIPEGTAVHLPCLARFLKSQKHEQKYRLATWVLAITLGRIPAHPSMIAPLLTQIAALQQLSTQHRVVAPRLSAEQLKAARSAPQSLLGSASSGLLSPVLSDPWNRSPPPRTEADDYIGSYGHWGRKKRHGARRAKRKVNARKDSLAPIPSLDPFDQKSCSSREAGTRTESSASNSQPFSGKTDSKTAPECRVLTLQSQESGPGVKDLSLKATSSKAVTPPPSSAMITLRRLSQPILAPPISLPGVARRMSNALSVAFNIRTSPKSPSFGDQSPEDCSIESLMERSNRSSNNKSTHRCQNRQRLASKDQPETPASITVRKASSAHQFNAHPHDTKLVVSPNHLHAQTNAVHIKPPNIELVAFYSEHRQECLPQNGLVNSGPGMEASEALRSCTGCGSCMPQLTSFTDSRRQSVVADPAVTFADVHIAPGTFIVYNMPSRASLALPDAPQRVSAIQFRSRNSVHEIIWKEDDDATSTSSNTCSSLRSSSPDREAQFETILPLGPHVNGSTPHSPQLTTNQGLHIPFLDSVQGPSHAQPRAKLSQVSWDVRKVSPTAEIPDRERS